MEFTIKPLATDDRIPVMDIFNHYIENSFAAYPDTRLPYSAFDILLAMSKGYPTGVIKDRNGQVAGFGMLRPYHQIPAFSKSAEISYFLHPDYTGKGMGTKLLAYLEKGARKMELEHILASISSLNPGSIAFHEKHGFVRCGCFKNIGRKKGTSFDVLWMQKNL